MLKQVRVPDKHSGLRVNPMDIQWVDEEADEQPEWTQVYIGKIPIMIKSDFCILSDLTEEEQMAQGECPFDQGYVV